MAIFSDFKKIPVKYYGNGDLSGNYFLKAVIDNIDSIENNIKYLNSPLNNQTDLYHFLWLLSFKELVLEIDNYNIYESLKERIKTIDSNLDYSYKRFVQYVNDNYKTVFAKEENLNIRYYELFRMLIELCFKCSSAINKEVFLYLESNYALYLLSDFKFCSNYFKKNVSEYKSLFDNLKNTKLFDDKIYVDFFLNQVNINDDFIKDNVQFICSRTIDYFESNNINSDNVELIQLLNVFEEYRELANYYKLSIANRFNIFKQKLDSILEEFLVKHGQHSQIGPVDLKPEIEILKKNKDPYKFFQLTHSLKNDKYINSLDYILNLKNNSSTSESLNHVSDYKSNKYPYYKQQSMEIYMWVQQRLLNLIMCDEDLYKEFGNFVLTSVKHVENNFFHNRINLSNEIMGSYEVILNIIGLARNNDVKSPLYVALINGCVMNLCGTIEKIIRNATLEEFKDIMYFDEDSNTLNTLLGYDIKSISGGLKYFLEFYLCKEINNNIPKAKRPGKNIRNIQMHNHNLKYESTNWADCCNLFYFILSIINDLVMLPYNKE